MIASLQELDVQCRYAKGSRRPESDTFKVVVNERLWWLGGLLQRYWEREALSVVTRECTDQLLNPTGVSVDYKMYKAIYRGEIRDMAPPWRPAGTSHAW